MIFKIAFNIVGITAFISILYLQYKMFFIALEIRDKNRHLIGKGWNGRATIRQYKKLNEISKDENSKKIIKEFFKYRKTQIIILIAGFSLFFLIAFLNRRFNN